MFAKTVLTDRNWLKPCEWQSLCKKRYISWKAERAYFSQRNADFISVTLNLNKGIKGARASDHTWEQLLRGVSGGSLTKNGRKSQEGKRPGYELETIFTAQVHLCPHTAGNGTEDQRHHHGAWRLAQMSWDPEMGDGWGCYWHQLISAYWLGWHLEGIHLSGDVAGEAPVCGSFLEWSLTHACSTAALSQPQQTCLASLGPWLFPAPTRSLQQDTQICSSGFLTGLDN